MPANRNRTDTTPTPVNPGSPPGVHHHCEYYCPCGNLISACKCVETYDKECIIFDFCQCKNPLDSIEEQKRIRQKVWNQSKQRKSSFPTANMKLKNKTIPMKHN